MPPPYNDEDVLQHIDNQSFYNANLGPFLTGLSFQMFFMGILCVQCWTYFETMAATDARWNRWLAGCMLFTGAFQTATNFKILYATFVIGYGRILHWNQYHWTLIYDMSWTAFIALVAHIFFMHRCFVVTRSYILLVICGLSSAAAFGAAIAGSVGLAKARYYTHSQSVIQEATTWLVATAVTDVAISAVLIFKLQKTRATVRSTDRMISKMIRLAFETASLTAVVAILNVILYAGYGSQHSAYLFFQFIVGKMYNHSVMVTLLARNKIRESSSATCNVHVVSGFPWRRRNRSSSSPERSFKNSVAGGVSITTTRIHVTDPVPLTELPKARRASRLRLSARRAVPVVTDDQSSPEAEERILSRLKDMMDHGAGVRDGTKSPGLV